jgi:hypothetical protein
VSKVAYKKRKLPGIPSRIPEGFELVTQLAPREDFPGCDQCWKDGVAHNGPEAVFGGPCYIRLAYCEHLRKLGFRMRPDRRTCLKSVTKDRRGRWIWYGYRKRR